MLGRDSSYNSAGDMILIFELQDMKQVIKLARRDPETYIEKSEPGSCTGYGR